MIRIASGQAFWGDWPQGPLLQVRSGPIDYLVLDYLAELTMAILGKQHRRDLQAGYARDFVDDIGDLLPEIIGQDIKVIASAGGVNPRACAKALLARAKEHGISGLRVGIVEGDEILGPLTAEGGPQIPITPLDRTEAPFAEVAPKLTSAHVYLGAQAIVEALREGAQIVVTGRCTDTALALAPMIHEFDIAPDDWDALALGTVCGHIIECGAQSTGGNYLENWRAVPDPERLGFPIAEIHALDHAVITKHESLGGLVNLASVKEQLLYEIGDPRAYVTPDCIPDFTTIQLEQLKEDRVGIRGVKGRPAPDTLKVSCVYDAGWKVSGQMTYCWPEALEKARAAGDLVRRRTEARLGEGKFDEWLIETVGAGACLGEVGPPPGDLPEVVLRLSARSSERAACDYLGRELIGLVLTGPPGATGYAAGRPRASQLSAIWSGLVPRSQIHPRAEVLTNAS
jgi:hypothetical protein